MKANVKAMGFGFGFSAVNAGQRNTSVEPQVIAVSTEGNFRLTGPVTRALGIEHGDYVMFLSNVDNVDAAINDKHEQIVAFCEENGLTLGSPEAAIAIHKAMDMWAIAKGVVEYDTKGNQKTTTERLTKNDKIKFVSQNFDDMLTACMNSEEVSEEVKEALSRDGVTKEEQIDILTAYVIPRELPKFKGSKAAHPSAMTGAGVTLNFTDSNVWKQLKADMGKNADKLNRIFDVDIENIQEIPMHDGYKEITVKALILGESVDKEPARVGKNGGEE